MRSMVIIEGSNVHALGFFYFLANGGRLGMFSSLKTSAPQGELSQKFQLIMISRFVGDSKETNKNQSQKVQKQSCSMQRIGGFLLRQELFL